MIRSMINRLMGVPEAPQPAPVVAAPDPRGTPGTRVHHEYFVNQIAAGWHWKCRVYAQNGAVTETDALAPNESAAHEAAIDWANKTKAGLRGEA